MADVLSRILAWAQEGGGQGRTARGIGGWPLREPRLPADEAGRSGGARRGPPPMQEQAGPVGMRGVALLTVLAWLLQGRGGAAGLASLADKLRSAGLGDAVESWVSAGPNHDIRPGELARAIPPEALDDIERHTGLGRDAVLSALSRGLPGLVDRLTPRGRLPERDEELEGHDENDVLGSLGIGPIRRG